MLHSSGESIAIKALDNDSGQLFVKAIHFDTTTAIVIRVFSLSVTTIQYSRWIRLALSDFWLDSYASFLYNIFTLILKNINN
jgi:hypothetical protein